jgi:hypothetical protein
VMMELLRMTDCSPTWVKHSDQHRQATPRCYSLIVRTTLEVGRLSLAEPFTCFKIASS